MADVALRIKDMCKRYGISAQGVADDAAGIRNQDGISVVDSFADNGVYFREAGKGSRVGGWQHMRELLNDAGKVDRPGLYISDACQYFWSTAPFIGRSMRNVEDCEGGLSRAFLLAGARGGVSTLWTVDDTYTLSLMRGFYRNWAVGQGPSLALANAKRRLLRTFGSKLAPYSWAAFVLEGDGSRALGPPVP